MRAQLFHWGWRAAGQPDCAAIVDLAVSVEILRRFALFHDDVVDRSDTRRGTPTAHRQFSALHETSGWRSEADHFGFSSSFLLGDALLVWAVMVIGSSALWPTGCRSSGGRTTKCGWNSSAGTTSTCWQTGPGSRRWSPRCDWPG
ncbi:polyprenyl synthetase family protein [Amycolatopsis sp. NPDC088138]|uniref:polyprenyl synthetase family protein n=1 Tax=Amycolatopsis sp. NPDC088138 TaxID=3363938 RepID=UPI00380994DF